MTEPLRDDAAERALLGAVLLDNGVVDDAAEVVSADDFARPGHRVIWQAMQRLATERQPIDYVTLLDALRASQDWDRVGLAAVTGLDADVPSSGNWRRYAEVVRDLALRRRLVQTAAEIVQSAHDTTRPVRDVVGGAEQAIHAVSDTGAATARVQSFGDAVASVWREMEALFARGSAITGVASGLRDLDAMTCGFQVGHLVVLAGRPSMGKSALALTIAVQAAIESTGGVVYVASLEMTADENIHRIISSRARVDGTRFRDGRFSEHDFAKMGTAVAAIERMPLYVDDRTHLAASEMRATLRRLRARHGGVRLVVVDYLQLMRSTDEGANREQQVAGFSRALKGIAKEFKCPVIALSQLNRGLEQRADKRPMMSDLRESGAIEQDADVIAFIYRDEVYNKDTDEKGVAEVIISKFRGGSLGTVRLRFDGATTTFRDL